MDTMNIASKAWWCAIGAALSAAGCSKGGDLTLQERTVTSVSAASGGRAVSADGRLVLDFPAGAIATDREIAITTRREVADVRLGSLAYVLGPDGLTFAKPVPIAITVAADRVGVFAVGNLDGATPVVVEGSTWDDATKTARASLAHFSTYGAITVYSACDGKGCGDPCTVCDPAIPGCVEPAPAAKSCDSSGQCLDATTVSCSSQPPDAGDGGTGAALGEACRTDVDCAGGAKCLYWSEGCERMGVCEAACPNLFDACVGCTDHCGCDGVSFRGCADRPFAHRGLCEGGLEAGVSDGGGTPIEWPDTGTGQCAFGAQCPSGICLFTPGCAGAPGRCLLSTTGCSGGLPADPDGSVESFEFCGCDDVTYVDSCATRPFLHEGACSAGDGGM